MALCTHVHRVYARSMLPWLVLESSAAAKRYSCCVHGLQRTICNPCEPWQHVPSSKAAQPHWENLVSQNAPQTNNWGMFGAFLVLLVQTERPSKMWRSHKTTRFSGNPQLVENYCSEWLLNPVIKEEKAGGREGSVGGEGGVTLLGELPPRVLPTLRVRLGTAV